MLFPCNTTTMVVWVTNNQFNVLITMYSSFISTKHKVVIADIYCRVYF